MSWKQIGLFSEGFEMRRWSRYVTIFLMMTLWTLACAKTPLIDMGNPSSSVSTSPRITDVRFLGQSPRSNEILVFELDFDDADGDLDQGVLDIFLNGERTSQAGQALKPLFLQSEIDPKARAGTFRLSVELSFSGGSSNPQKAPFDVAMQVRDRLGHISNLVKAHFFVEVLSINKG